MQVIPLASSYLCIVDLLLPPPTDKSQPCNIPPICQQENGIQQSGIEGIYPSLFHGFPVYIYIYIYQIMVSRGIAGGSIGDGWLATLAAQVTWALLRMQRFGQNRNCCANG